MELHIVNCKPGDLAIVIHTTPTFSEFLGHIVRVKDLALTKRGNMAWQTDPQFVKDGVVVLANDECLRPIKWSGERDEMIVRIGKPERV
jgi:hypothetical protein